jgi:hypothetical protein
MRCHDHDHIDGPARSAGGTAPAISRVAVQLIANVAGWADEEVWDVEDDALLEAARSHLAAVAKPEQEVCA